MTPALTDRARAAGRALADVGGTATPGELGKLLGLPPATQARIVARLREVGYVDGPKNRLELTPAGWAAFAPRPAVGAGQVLDDALARWPYPHQCFLELLVSAIIARHHLGERRALDGEHLGFWVIGGTGTGKSSMADFVCALFGWDQVAHRVFVDRETEGSIKGRRVGPPGAMTFDPSPFAALPFVFFDELDNADEPVRRAVLPYLQGQLRVNVEGEAVTYRPTPMVAANPPRSTARYSQLRTEYRRRCVVLDVGDAYRGAELEAALLPFYEALTPGRPLLPLEQLEPPAVRLPEEARQVLGKIRDVLTEQGLRLLPLRQLELATLGRAALLGPDVDVKLAAYATITSYLGTAETLQDGPEVEPTWHLNMDAVRSVLDSQVGVEHLDAAIARAQAHRAARLAVVGEARKRAVVEDLGVTRRRAELVAELRQAGEQLHGGRLPPAHRTRAAGIRAQLTKLRDRAAHQQTLEGLEEVAELARPVLVDVRQVVLEVDQQRRAERDQRDLEKRQRQLERDMARRHPATGPNRDQKRAWSSQLDQVRVLARELEQLWKRKRTRPDEDAFQELRRIQVPSLGPVLAYRELPPEPPAQGFIEKFSRTFGGPRAPGVWRSTVDDRIRFSGWPGSCSALKEWGPATRQILEPVLTQLHAAEDQLVRTTGRKPRSGRPTLGVRTPAAVRQLPTARAIGR